MAAPSRSAPPPPTVAEVEAITALPDLLIRNLRITQAYHELSAALGRLLSTGANWCTYAVWASKQAGQSIRQEDLLRAVERELAVSPELKTALDRTAGVLEALARAPRPGHVRGTLLEILLDTSATALAGEAVSRGNLVVFAEIGREVARYLAELGGETAFDAAPIERFCSQLAPGDPPGGQGLLRQAFAHYHRARFEPQPKRRAELTFLANLEIGLHEQTRLQPEIEAALDAPSTAPETFKRRALAALFPDLEAARRLFRRSAHVDLAFDRLAAEARRALRGAITECLMTYTLPTGEVLRIGRDVLPPSSPSLARLEDPELPELIALVARLDAAPETPRGSAASDWADLGERMHYIVEVFRSSFESPEMFQPPFSPKQVAALKAGRRPEGRL